MRKLYPSILYILFLLFFFQENGSSQINVKNCSNTKTGWTTNNPFHTDVFVENFGQFDNWAKTPSPIKYAVNTGNPIFFTQQSLIFKLKKVEKLSEKEHEERERKGEEGRTKTTTYFVTMQWEGSNPDAIMEVSTPTEGYYTFGEQGYENIKAKGYKKLTYKNLYPQIDVEYIIPEKGGIKYQIILHLGADLSVVKMHYTGDVEELKIDNGNVIIKTPAGNITDHTPQSFYEEDNAAIPSAFEIKGNTVSFKLKTENSQLKTIIIDPWTTTPTSLTTNNAAYDIDFDDYGNAYVSGGGFPYKLSKYSNTGTLLWTFTNPKGWNSTLISVYSRFCIIPQTGTAYIGEGLQSLGPRVMKIASDGSLTKTSLNAIGTKEIWVMFYNRCSGQLIGFGGGTSNTNNLTMLSDTNLTSYLTKTFNGDTQISNGDISKCCNDVAAVEMDYNGDFYALMSSKSNQNSNHLQKSLVVSNYSPPCAWDVNSGYLFTEAENLYLDPSAESNRANALALNSQFLFSYDGKTLKSWDKATGNLFDSIVADNGYWEGKDRLNDGIAVDECNNVYVGGMGKVHVFNFDSTAKTFTAKTAITTNIPDNVYDVRLERATNTLYVCGYNFVTVTEVASCNTIYTLTTKDSVDYCSGYAGVVAVSGGTPPYTYKWSNGDTTSSISNVPAGTYTVTISDNSCRVLRKIDTVQISSTLYIGKDTVLCNSSSFTIDAGNPGSTFSWSTGAKTQTISVNTPGIYWVEVSNGACKSRDTINVTFLSATPVNLGNDTSTCENSLVLNAGVPGASYLWNTGANTQTISVDTSGIYRVEVTSGLCKSKDSVKVTFLATPLVNIGNDTIACQPPLVLNAGISGASYLWNTGANTQTISVSTSGTYWVEVNASGCTNRDSVEVTYLPTTPVNLGNDISTCGNSLVLDAGIAGATYLWNSGASTQTITVSTSGAYSVQVTKNGCSDSDTISVAFVPTPVVNLGADTSLCMGETITLDAGNAGAAYLWSSGDTSKNFVVSTIGIYWVIVKNYLCESSDSVSINFRDCEVLIQMPNVFTPNGDGKNDRYLPIVYKGILQANIKIYNRWGNLVYESDNLLEGWNGLDNGAMMCSDGTYYWIVDYIDILNNHTLIDGFLSLFK